MDDKLQYLFDLHDSLETEDEEKSLEQENRCVVKISTSYWHDKNGIYSKKSLRFLRRKCKGHNWISEDASMIGADEIFPRIVNLNDCEDGIYDVIIVNDGLS